MQKPFSAGAESLGAIAAQLLGWDPDQFWKMTPRELTTIFDAFKLDGGATVAPLDNRHLEKLKEQYPDG